MYISPSPSFYLFLAAHIRKEKFLNKKIILLKMKWAFIQLDFIHIQKKEKW